MNFLWVKKYKYEVISLFVNIGSAFFAFRFKESNDNDILFYSSTSLFVVSILAIIYLKTREKDFFFLPMKKSGEEKNWSGRGKFFHIRNENCFEITESSVGYIFPKTLTWDDYSFQFDFKIINRHLGWIVRANNLSNYVMLQCSEEGINPHIRIDSIWVTSHYDDPAVNLKFERPLSPDTWYRSKIICEKRNIRIIIYKEKEAIFDRHWILPPEIFAEYIKSNGDKFELRHELDFDMGAIGFRDYGDEKGLVRNVYVEKL